MLQISEKHADRGIISREKTHSVPRTNSSIIFSSLLILLSSQSPLCAQTHTAESRALHTRRRRYLLQISQAHANAYIPNTHVIVPPIRRRASTRRGRRGRRGFLSRRRRRGTSTSTSSARSASLLLNGLLLIVLIVSQVVGVPAIRRIRISAGKSGVVLSVLSSVVCARSSGRARGGTGWGGRRLSGAAAAAVGAVGVLGAVAPLLAIFLAVAAPVSTVWGVFFEALVLLFDVREQVFAEFASVLDFLGIRTAAGGLVP